MNSSAGMSMIVEACSWTLVHSLWQASLWGGMALLGLRVIAARAGRGARVATIRMRARTARASSMGGIPVQTGTRRLSAALVP